MPRYPQHIERWRPLIQKYWPAYAVDKALWVLSHESSGNAAARNSSSGASGLFQILPSVHGQGNWMDPEENVRYAAKLYSQSGWKPWGGAGNTYNGKAFGALGKNPYPDFPETSTSWGSGKKKESSSSRYSRPVYKGRITQVFGPTNEKLDSGGRNVGIDIGVPVGTSISSVTDGTVVSITNQGTKGWGLSVKVRDAQGNIHNYGHLSGTSVKKGQKVKSGQVIAKSGNTGASTGPHLSYDVKGKSGSYVDPSPWLGFNAAGDNRKGHAAIGRDISEVAPEIGPPQTGGSGMNIVDGYYSRRAVEIQKQINDYDARISTLRSVPTVGDVAKETRQREIERLQGEREALQRMLQSDIIPLAKQEQLDGGGDDTWFDEQTIAQNWEQIEQEWERIRQGDESLEQDWYGLGQDDERIEQGWADLGIAQIHAEVAQGNLELDRAIAMIDERLAKQAESRQRAMFIQERQDEAARWAPREPGQRDYTGADISGAHAQALGQRGFSPDATVAQYSGTRTVDPAAVFAQQDQAMGVGQRGSAPGQGWQEGDSGPSGSPIPGAQEYGESPAPGPDTRGRAATAEAATASPGRPDTSPGAPNPPGTGIGTTESPTFAGNAPPSGHPASTSPGASTPTFGGNTPPAGHPAGGPSYSGSPPVGQNRISPEMPSIPNDPRGPNPRINQPPYMEPQVPSHIVRPGSNTPPPGHPAQTGRLGGQGSSILRDNRSGNPLNPFPSVLDYGELWPW